MNKKVTKRRLSEYKEMIAGQLNWYLFGNGYWNSFEDIIEGMCNSKSIYDATMNLDMSLELQEETMKNRGDLLMKKFVEYFDKWVNYNKLSWDYPKCPDIVSWILKNEIPNRSKLRGIK